MFSFQRQIPHTKAQVLSRRVWDILGLLPTSPTLLQGFKQLDIPLVDLLDPSSAQKLMYSLYIVESLSTTIGQNKYQENDKEPWCRKFIQQGGLRHLFDIFMSGKIRDNEIVGNFLIHIFFFKGVLQRDGGNGSEWQQDCLASLLKIICHLGVDPLPIESRPSRSDKIIIPNLNEV